MKAKLLTAALCVFSTTAFAGSFVNGNFESGDFTGWTQGAGYLADSQTTNNLNPSDFMAGGSQYDMSANASAIVSPGLDPNTGNHLNMVYSGNHSARVNDSNPNYSVGVISQTVNSYTDPSIYFAWAAVLEESHGPTDSDVFQLLLTDDTKGTTLYNVTYNSATAPAGLFSTYEDSNYNTWYYTDWQVQNLDVSADQGDTFTMTLLASDCPYGGHAGYVYLDGFGAVLPPPSSGVPEPSSYGLLAAGMLGLGFACKKMKLRRN